MKKSKLLKIINEVMLSEVEYNDNKECKLSELSKGDVFYLRQDAMLQVNTFPKKIKFEQFVNFPLEITKKNESTIFAKVHVEEKISALDITVDASELLKYFYKVGSDQLCFKISTSSTSSWRSSAVDPLVYHKF